MLACLLASSKQILGHERVRQTDAAYNNGLVLKNKEAEAFEEGLRGPTHIGEETRELQFLCTSMDAIHKNPAHSTPRVCPGNIEVVNVTVHLEVGVSDDSTLLLDYKRSNGAHLHRPSLHVRAVRCPCIHLSRGAVARGSRMDCGVEDSLQRRLVSKSEIAHIHERSG